MRQPEYPGSKLSASCFSHEPGLTGYATPPQDYSKLQMLTMSSTLGFTRHT